MPAAITSDNLQAIFNWVRGWMVIIVNDSIKTQLADDAVLHKTVEYVFPTNNISWELNKSDRAHGGKWLMISVFMYSPLPFSLSL